VAVDPKQEATSEPDLGTDEVSTDDAQAPSESQEEQQPTEPSYVQELRESLAQATQNAAEAREYARRAQGVSNSTVTRLAKTEERLTKMLSKALTTNMSEEERAAFSRDAELEFLREERQQAAAPGDDPQLREWQSFASRALEKSGLKHDDPRLTEAFHKHAGGSQNPQDWHVALAAALADVKGGEAERAKAEAQKAQEQERVKARNGSRAAEGKIDRSSPSGQARVRVGDMSDAEFDKYWEQRKAEAARRSPVAGQ